MALRTVSNTGGNWNATTTWVGGVVPIAADTVDFTAISGNLTVNVSTANLAGIDFTNYVGTITINNNINILNGITNLGTGGYTQLGTNGLILLGGANTVISNGTVWSRTLTFSTNSSTITLSDNLYVTGNILFTSAALYTLNGNSLYVGGDLTMGANGVLGTTTIIFNGTGTWLNTGAIAGIKNNLTINTLGTLTVSGNVYYQTGTLTYIAGTVVSTGSVLNIVNSTTINTSGMTWRDVALTTGTQTLTSDLNSEVLRMNGNGNVSVNNSGGNMFTLTLIQNGTGILQGTASINLIGTGSWVNSSTGQIRNNLNINTAGTLTIGANVYYNTGTLTYTAGIVDTTTNNSTLNIGGSTTLNSNGLIWNNVNTFANTTLTLSTDLIFIGTCNMNGSGTTTITLAGAGIINSPNGTLQLKANSGNLTLTTSATHNILNYQLNAEGYSVATSATWNVYGNLIRNFSGAGRSAMGTVNLIGTGSVLFNGGATGALVGNININTLGTITFGSVTFPNVYYEQSTITYIGGTVDASNCNLLIGFTITSATTTLNTKPINWKNITLNGSNTLLLTSDLNLIGNLTTQGGIPTTINGLFNVNIGGNLRNVGLNTTVGTATLILNGTGTLSTDSNSNGFQNNVIINAKGTITIGTFFYYSIGTLTYITGKVVAKNSTLILGTSTLINCHKINFNNVEIGGGQIITMNEFFSGSPSLVTKISGTHTITFQDGFEKIAKFVDISGCTLSKPLQLLVLTNSKKSSTNRGIRYINQSPNGIAKGEPSVNLTTYGAGGLLADPN